MLYKELKKLAVDDLAKYYYLKKSLETIPHEISLLQNSSLYFSPAVSASVMSSSSADAKMIKLLSRIETMESQLKQNTEKISNMDIALNSLRSSEKEILFSYYINRQRKSVTRLSVDSITDRSALYRRAERALKKYILAYFGTTGE